MNIAGYTTDEIYNLPDDDLYAILGDANKQNSPVHDLFGGIMKNEAAQKMAVGDFFKKFQAREESIKDGKEKRKNIWPQIKGQVCAFYTSNQVFTDKKTLFDALLGALAALITTNPLIIVVLAIAVKAGLNMLCDVPNI